MPTSNFGADGMANLIAAELDQAVTDPDINAWYDSQGKENALKCNFTLGTTYAAPGGGVANMNLGGRDWLIQQNWVNARPPLAKRNAPIGYCGLSYP